VLAPCLLSKTRRLCRLQREGGRRYVIGDDRTKGVRLRGQFGLKTSARAKTLREKRVRQPREASIIRGSDKPRTSSASSGIEHPVFVQPPLSRDTPGGSNDRDISASAVI